MIRHHLQTHRLQTHRHQTNRHHQTHRARKTTLYPRGFVMDLTLSTKGTLFSASITCPVHLSMALQQLLLFLISPSCRSSKSSWRMSLRCVQLGWRWEGNISRRILHHGASLVKMQLNVRYPLHSMLKQPQAELTTPLAWSWIVSCKSPMSKKSLAFDQDIDHMWDYSESLIASCCLTNASSFNRLARSTNDDLNPCNDL